MKTIKLSALLLLSTFIFTGCVTGTRNLENLQVPEYSNDKNASGNVYIAQVSDNRVFQHKPDSPSIPSVKGDLKATSKETLATLIGRQRNGYGAAMGDVAMPEGETVHDAVRELLTEGLESRGYTVVDDKSAPNKVTVDINKFWAWFSPGFTSVSFESDVQCEIDFVQSSGNQKFSVKGYGLNKGQMASNANWELAFQRAFQDFLENLDKTMDSSGL